MIKIVRTTATAICWTERHCRIVRLQRSRDKFKVLSFWEGAISKERPLAELIVSGIDTISVADQEFIVVGATGTGWGSVDLTMPALSHNEYRNALQFELRKQTPVPPEKLRWGYRILEEDSKAKNCSLRLFYIKDEEWAQWCSVLKGLSHVDVILPSALALDPLFADKDILVPEENLEKAFLYSSINGKRTIIERNIPADAKDLDEVFPVAKDFLLGQLAEKPFAQQVAFIPALISAAYGLSHNSNRDQKTLLPIPEDLQAHRNIGSKILATGMFFFIIATLLSGVLRQMQSRAAHIRKIDSEISKIEVQLKALQANLGSATEKDFAAVLEEELRSNDQHLPSFTEALLELTEIIEAPTWASSRLEWNAGQISLQLQSTQRDLELAGKLEESPVLGDVRELSSSFNQGTYILRYALNARYDTEEEKTAFAERRRKRQEQAAQRAAEEAAAAAAAAEEEAAEAEDYDAFNGDDNDADYVNEETQ